MCHLLFSSAASVEFCCTSFGECVEVHSLSVVCGTVSYAEHHVNQELCRQMCVATTPGRNAKSKQVSLSYLQLDVKIEVTSLSDPSLRFRCCMC